MSHYRNSARPGGTSAMLLVLLLVASASPALAGQFVMNVWKSMVTARMDPIVSPGAVSQHSHHIIGANGFTTQYQPDQIRKSECTNAPIQVDMSNYWFPQVFQRTADGKFLGMPTGTRVYYMFNEEINIEPFPYKFQMVAGDPARKSKNSSNTFDGTASYFCSAPASGKVGYGTPGFPTELCKTLIMKIFTPSCWNGIDYNPADPHAHMRYPEDYWNGKQCPKTHPRRLPVILLESFHTTNNGKTSGIKLPKTGQPHYILANGDTTGYGLHADMQNGWDVEVLRTIIKTCHSKTATAAEKKRCSALEAHSDNTKANACRYTGSRPNESTGWNGTVQPLASLPGCNLPWFSGPKPKCNPKQQGRTALAVQWIKTKATERFA